VRLIDENGTNCGVVSLNEALSRASAVGLDLVEISRQDPPVCKIIEFKKWLFEQEKAARRSKQKNQQTKELRFNVNIAEADRARLVSKAVDFLANNHRVKVTVYLKGRQHARPEQAREKLEEFCRHVVGDSQKFQISSSGRNFSALLEPAKTTKSA